MSVMRERVRLHTRSLRYDTANDEILDRLDDALLTGTELLSLIAHGDETTPPILAATSPAYAPLPLLPYAVQWTGGTLPDRLPGESDEDYLPRARAEAASPRGAKKCTAPAIRIAGQAHLEGTRYARVVQRPAGDLWRALLRVRSAECTDEAATVADVNDPEVLPAGMRIDVQTSDGPLWQEATRTFAELASSVTAANVTLADVT